MTPNTAPRRFGRQFVIGATAIGITLGVAGLASAAQAVLSGNDDPTPSVVSVANDTPGADDTSTTVDDNGTDTSDVTESSLESSADDSVEDEATASSIDDNSDDDSDDDSSSSSSTPQALPDPFTKTYTSAGGSITVSWTGTAFTLDSVDPVDGSSPEIKDQRWDRVRVEFKGSAEGRIEVRLSDDDNSIRVRID